MPSPTTTRMSASVTVWSSSPLPMNEVPRTTASRTAVMLQNGQCLATGATSPAPRSCVSDALVIGPDPDNAMRPPQEDGDHENEDEGFAKRAHIRRQGDLHEHGQ